MDDGIVIGEGVLLDARPTSFATRLLAALLDLVVLGLVLLAIVVVAAQTSFELSEAGSRIVLIVALATITVIGPTTTETLTRGRSLGKLAAGIRIVRDDGGPIRFRHALVRTLMALLEIWASAGSVALIASMVHPKGKRLGDMLAGTYAVRVRGGQRALPPVLMPPELVGWVHGTDIRRLPDGLALRARQFLGRAGTLHPGSRVRLGMELAGEMEHYVAPGPPVGTHPERFIAAVLAERRDREYRHAVVAAHRAAAESALLHRLPFSVPDPVD